MILHGPRLAYRACPEVLRSQFEDRAGGVGPVRRPIGQSPSAAGEIGSAAAIGTITGMPLARASAATMQKVSASQPCTSASALARIARKLLRSRSGRSKRICGLPRVDGAGWTLLAPLAEHHESDRRWRLAA